MAAERPREAGEKQGGCGGEPGACNRLLRLGGMLSTAMTGVTVKMTVMMNGSSSSTTMWLVVPTGNGGMTNRKGEQPGQNTYLWRGLL